MSGRKPKAKQAAKREATRKQTERIPDTDPNWSAQCEVCGSSPVVGEIGLCGPCCFGEAAAAGGNW